MAVTIQTRRDTAANWTLANPVLALGEIGIETDTDKAKYGDGFAAWADLPYFIDGEAIPPGASDGQTLRWEATPGEWQASDALVISDAGKVGIGTATPSQQLEVFDPATSSIIRLTCDDGSDYAEIYSDTNGVMAIDANASNTGAAANLRLRVSGTEVLRATPAGNVGIGTFSPGNRLHVEDSAAYQLTLKHPLGAAAEIGIGSTNEWLFTSDATERMRINGAGDVIVGGSSYAAAGSVGFKPDGSVASVLTNGAGGELLLGAIGGVSNGYQISVDTSNNQTYTWFNGGTVSMRVAPDSNVGIRTASPIAQLHIVNPSGQQGFYISRGSDTSFGQSASFRVICGSTAPLLDAYGDSMRFRTAATGGSALERMRLGADGNLWINTTAAIAVGKVQVKFNNAEHGANWQCTSASGSPHIFYNSGGTAVGSIFTNASSTTYSTTSDYRLKENEAPIADGLERLLQLKPYRFNFKAEPGVKVDGFFAHEAQTVVPEAVIGKKDGEEMQGIDQSKLVPLLVAAVQELHAEVAALKAQIT